MSDAAPKRAWWWLTLPALPLLVIGLGGTHGASDEQIAAVQPDLAAYALVVVAALSLLLRRNAPLVGLAICGAALVTYFPLGYAFGPILLTGPCAVYAVVERVELRRAILASTAFLVATGAAVAPRFVDLGGWLGYLAWLITWAAVLAAPAAVGSAIRSRRQAAEEVRAEQARRAVADERLRMTQEVHDVVGHGLAAIAMQAGVALHVLDRSPERARESLQAIRDTSRDALEGLRSELDQLREPSAEPATRRPTATLHDLAALVGRMRAAGLDLRIEVDPASDAVPDRVALTAYRIVQESLTNVLRHAGAVHTSVRLTREAGDLVVEVLDDGPSAATAGPLTVPTATGSGGLGIAGMRSRAIGLGGTFSAAPRSGGGFAVLARLPIASLPPELATETAPLLATEPT